MNLQLWDVDSNDATLFFITYLHFSIQGSRLFRIFVKTKIMKFSLLLIVILLFSSCFKGEQADVIIHNAVIHSMDESMTEYEAMAIRDGKIIELGPERQILNKYSSDEIIDAQGKDVYPGLTDAHGHILSYAQQKLSVDLIGCKSMAQLIVRTEKFQQQYKRDVIIGRGWDQSLWGETDLPNNRALNEAFPNTPVCLYRVDGHALLANDAMLKLAGITSDLLVDGGIILLKEGEPTGVLVDNAMELVNEKLPEFSKEEMSTAVLDIQAELFMYGITGVHEAGVDVEDVALFKSLIDQGGFDLNVYAMLSANEKSIDFARKNGVYEYKNLLIRSFKVYGDGALGSRGAFLKQAYFDAHDHHGVLTTTQEEMRRIANACLEVGYQMNTHAIGDSTNRILLELYELAANQNPDHRWRIEHAQVVDPKDFDLFAKFGVIPSIQPTHAVSDQRWAEARLGKERMKGAYAYNTLLKSTGIIAIGTDFPVENTDPFMTIFAATKRKNSDGYPSQGFYSNEAISLNDCLSGMTKWAALAAFQEDHLGVLAKGMDATFAIFEKPIRVTENFEPNFASYTFIKGKKVYSTE